MPGAEEGAPPVLVLSFDAQAALADDPRLDPELLTHGDTRKRGMALLRFKQTYLASGFELTDSELPVTAVAVRPRTSRVRAVAVTGAHAAGIDGEGESWHEADAPCCDGRRRSKALMRASSSSKAKGFVR